MDVNFGYNLRINLIQILIHKMTETVDRARDLGKAPGGIREVRGEHGGGIKEEMLSSRYCTYHGRGIMDEKEKEASRRK